MSRNTHTYGKPRAGKSMRSEASAPGGFLFTLHITQKGRETTAVMEVPGAFQPAGKCDPPESPFFRGT